MMIFRGILFLKFLALFGLGSYNGPVSKALVVKAVYSFLKGGISVGRPLDSHVAARVCGLRQVLADAAHTELMTQRKAALNFEALRFFGSVLRLVFCFKKLNTLR